MSRSAAGIQETSPAAKRVVTALEPYTGDMKPGRTLVKIGGRLGRSLRERGRRG